MIFRDISYRIAAQFMAFVFAMLVITGGIFFVADVFNRGHMNQVRLERQLNQVIQSQQVFGSIPKLPPFQRDRIRIVDNSGASLFSGALYEDIPFEIPGTRLTSIDTSDDEYDVLTVPIEHDGQVLGYVQVADRAPPRDLPVRLLIFLVISGCISGLTFGVGIFFARRSLKPAEQMMQRLEQFTQDASHELRTPLTAVSTSIDLALMSPDNQKELRAAKKDIKDIVILVERLLELARLDSFVLSKEDVDLSTLILDVVEKHRVAAQEKDVALDVRLPDPVTVSGDPALLRQVVGNLLANAIKFNKTGGKVTIELSGHTLTVSDTGRGISPQAIGHIFDRFFQEEASRTKKQEGLGLGLALVKRVVDLHGWTITVQSQEGKGTVFTVDLEG